MEQKGLLQVFLKGCAMGAADVVPGVSGGTVAFVTGVYDKLLSSLLALRPRLFKVYMHRGFKGVWSEIDGSFLFSLVAGIALSILSLSRGILFLLKEYPHPLWAFFFGLVLASSFVVSKKVTRWKLEKLIFLCLGLIVGYFLTAISPVEMTPNFLNVFLSGFIAICAMILPGISGSFILLILGMYTPIIEALTHFNFKILLLFATGCLCGLFSFARLLKWLFEYYNQITLSFLIGLMLGSLNKVWPWKETLQTFINRHGEQVPLIQKNVLPSTFLQKTGEDPLTVIAIIVFFCGLFFVVGIEKSNQDARKN